MVGRRFFKTTAIGLLLVLSIPFCLWAEGSLSMEYSLFETIYRTKDDSSYLFSERLAGSALLSYASRGNANVRSETSLRISFPELSLPVGGVTLQMPLIGLENAYLKARFPSFRLTAGKTRLSWGDGVLFNSGDLIFESLDTAVDLSLSELRSSTTYLAALLYPIDAFSFAEVVYLPSSGSLEDMGAGGRLYLTSGSMKYEAGYLFKGDTDSHSGYLSIQGNLGFDWYLATSSSYVDAVSDLSDEWNISAGLFSLVPIDRERTLSVRLETLLRPFGVYEEGTSGEPYWLYLYPELSLKASSSLSVSLRAIISPVDASASVSTMFDWNVLQGFSLTGYLLTELGEEDDTFSFSPSTGDVHGLVAAIGVRYLY